VLEGTVYQSGNPEGVRGLCSRYSFDSARTYGRVAGVEVLGFAYRAPAFRQVLRPCSGFFIVPEERLNAFGEEISELAARHSLVVLSWSDLLRRLENAVVDKSTAESHLFIGALDHFKEFCNVIKEKQFRPFTNEQLQSPVLDESASHLVWLTEEVVASAVKAGILRESAKPTPGYDSFFFNYGQTVLLRDVPCWFGYWPYAWKCSPSDGPLWVQFVKQDATRLELTGRFTDGIPIESNSLCFPLFKPADIPAASQQDEIDRVMTSLVKLADRLLLKKVGR
jgi:hypothetical protein